MARTPLLTTTAPAATSGFKHLATSLLAAPAAAITASGLSTSNKMFRITANALPATDSTNLFLRLNNDSGANYEYFVGYQIAGAAAGFSFTAQTEIRLNGNTDTLDNARHSLYLLVVGKATSGTRATGNGLGLIFQTTPQTGNNFVGLNWNNVADLISRFDILMSSGNLSTSSMMRVEGLIP